ncbi:MAG: late competence development ComFB family protein [Spirochaetia bacterium]
MKLKNYQEDVVLKAIEIALEDQKEYSEDEVFINDIAAYVLNRMPPKYIMSERGFTRLAEEHYIESDDDENLVNVIELMILINKGIELVKKRRKIAKSNAETDKEAKATIRDGEIEYIHNFPQIVGKVLDKKTKKPVLDATITLKINGKLSDPAEPGWINPYTTNAQTNGLFSFWPRAKKSSKSSETFHLKIEVEHNDFDTAVYEKEVNTKGTLHVKESIATDAVISVPTIYLISK